jgi:hypothetical protein
LKHTANQENTTLANQPAPASDPFSAWREWVNDSERQLNSFFNQLMGSDRYSQFLGRMTDLQIGMQKNTNEALTRFFASLNLPTRDDLAALNERLGVIEERLHAIAITLGAQREAGADARDTGAATPRPPRTKRPSAPARATR